MNSIYLEGKQCTAIRKDIKIQNKQLDDMMQEGYSFLEEKKEEECCAIWLEVWKHLKKRFSPNIESIEKAECVFSGTQSLFNWCQDLEMELANAGLEDDFFFQKRIEYCQEFCRLFPKTDKLIIENMKRAEAESYFALGEQEKGEQAFKALIEEFPRSAWAYIGWGDMYWLFRPNNKIPLNYEKAERIYQTALAKNVDDRKDVLERLEDLKVEKNKSENTLHFTHKEMLGFVIDDYKNGNLKVGNDKKLIGLIESLSEDDDWEKLSPWIRSLALANALKHANTEKS